MAHRSKGLWRATQELALLVTVLTTAPAALGAPQEIRLEEKERLALLVITPKGDVANVNTSLLIQLADAALKANTNLTADPLPQESVVDCKGRLSCIVLRVRGDYREADVRAGYRTFREYARARRERRERDVRYIAILTNLPQAGVADRLSAVLVETDRALEELHDHGTPGESEDELELRLLETAVVARAQPALLKNEAEARAFIDRLFSKELRNAFELGGNWQPYGAIQIERLPERTAIILDGSAIGVSQSETVKISGVTAGQRVVLLDNPQFEPYQTPVDVRAERTATVVPKLEPRSSALSQITRTAAVWTGAAMFAGGVALTVFSLASSSSHTQGCLVSGSDPAAGDCGGAEFLRSGGGAVADPFSDDPNQGALLLAPLGYSLAAGGGILSLGTMLATGEDDLPLWPALIGLGVGAALYGVSAALDGDRGLR